MPTWDQAERFITTVGLPTALVLVFVGAVLWYIVKPLSDNFLGKDGWIAKFFASAISTAEIAADTLGKQTEILKGHTERHDAHDKRFDHLDTRFNHVDEALSHLRRGGHGGDNNCGRLPKAS
jgi:hypothetical protein